jgi:hypothetical protein
VNGIEHGVLSTAIAVHLFGLGYEAKHSRDRQSYRFCIQVEPGRWRETLLVVHEEERVVRVVVELPSSGQVCKRSWIAELVHVANEQLAVFGFFVLGVDGRLSHRLADEYPDAVVSQDALERFLDRVAFPIRVFERALRYGKKGSVSPRTAIQVGLTENNGLDSSGSSSRIRRTVLELLP